MKKYIVEELLSNFTIRFNYFDNKKEARKYIMQRAINRSRFEGLPQLNNFNIRKEI